MEKFDYHFKVRSAYDTAINLAGIYNDIAYKGFNKTQLNNIFNTNKQDVLRSNYIQYFEDAVTNVGNKNSQTLIETINFLNQRWDKFKQQYYGIIEEVFDIKFKDQIVNNVYSELQFLPINEICVDDGSIYLNYNQSNEEIFIKFITMLTKLMLLQTWSNDNHWQFNTNFDAENKIFMFADIAVDAIFYNSSLKQLTASPSYKYFYNVNYQNSNMMDRFRQMYKNMKINNFLDEVYFFVYNNYSTLMQFKHYLY